MKTVIRMAGQDFAKPDLENDGKHDDDLWSGDLPLVPGRLPEFKVSVSDLEDDNPPKVVTVSQVCLEVCGDWSQQVIYVK
jgi:hypothetical protein